MNYFNLKHLQAMLRQFVKAKLLFLFQPSLFLDLKLTGEV